MRRGTLIGVLVLALGLGACVALTWAYRGDPSPRPTPPAGGATTSSGSTRDTR